MKYSIVIYASGMPFNGDTIPEGKSLGGSESAAYYMAQELVKKGHRVILFTNTDKNGVKDGVLYMKIGVPTEQCPLGEDFTKFAKSVPHDVMIIQRHPMAFFNSYNSKLNLFWTHDLALKRGQNQYNAQSFNVDRVLAVSEFHKNQVHEVWGIKTDSISVLRNGVDWSLYENASSVPDQLKIDSKTILFTSRPERGLEYLVAPGGIMEKLMAVDPEVRLMVCGYDNTLKEMEEYYQKLWQRCHELPNVMLLGPKGKGELAEIEKKAWLYIYPTEFEETSCITAMHSQAAGTPFVAADFGALAETLDNGGVRWVTTDQGRVSVDNFVLAVRELLDHPDKWRRLRADALKKGKEYKWTHSATELLSIIGLEFEKSLKNKHSVVEHLLTYSDVQGAKHYIENNKDTDFEDESDRIKDAWGAIFFDYKGFYDSTTKLLISKNLHACLGNSNYFNTDDRLKQVEKFLVKLEPGSKVLDYACLFGQHTTHFAEKYPQLNFIGVDTAKSAVAVGNNYIADRKLKNVQLKVVSDPDQLYLLDTKFDFILAGELIEHVLEPHKLTDGLEAHLAENGTVYMTCPSGVSDSYSEHVKLKEPSQHINHLTQDKIYAMLEGKVDLHVDHIAYGDSKDNRKRGSLMFSWKQNKDNTPSIPIDHAEHLKKLKPEETLSACMICEPHSETLGGTLESIKNITSEIIIGIDNKDGDWNEGVTYSTACRYTDKIFPIMTPSSIGFDEARNETVSKAKGDWILWIDDDEVLQWPEKLRKYLRSNCYDSYAIHQHHISAEPPGVIKTDWPCRVFRSNRGIRFYGVVHEHPETSLNEGAGHTFLIPQTEVAIMHYGYDSEATRRDRFLRNWPLMCLDRKKYPERNLAKFLFIRDLAHMNRFEFERTKVITQEMADRAQMGVNIWRDLLKDKMFRLLKDSLVYYSECADLLTNGNTFNYEL